MPPWLPAEPGPLRGTAVWAIDLTLSARQLALCEAALSAEERGRAGRFVRGEDRDRFLASHAALRFVLGRILARPPRDLDFEAGPAGKPELAPPSAGVLHFNLSHSGTRALVGVSTEGAIGVDVEALRPMPDAARVARSFFARDEADALATVPSAVREAAFMALWTRKEAVVKALGAGLSVPLKRFSVSLPPGPAAILSADGLLDPAAFTLEHLEPGPGTVGAVAVAAPEIRTGLFGLPPDWIDRLARPVEPAP